MPPTTTAPILPIAKPQLFLDQTWIADSFRVRRTWHQAIPHHQPLIQPDQPWENGGTLAYGTVLHWRGRFHAWYMIWSRTPGCCISYATSADGFKWEKPNLGLVSWNGTRHNNVVLTSIAPEGIIDDISVIDDPEDHQWPLKALFWDSGYGRKSSYRGPTACGYWAARSKDGIHWERLANVLPNWGDRFNACSTKIKGQYVVLGRIPSMMNHQHGRTVTHTQSPDLHRWSKPQTVIANDIHDPENLQMYSATLFPYSDWILGSIERMHMSPDILDIELIFSRDGIQWQRSRTPHSFIPLGQPGQWDSRWVNLTSNGPIQLHNRLLFYYTGRPAAHGATPPLNTGGISVAVLRHDGFCSVHAGENPGWMLTQPMTWPNADLLINADLRRDLTAHPTEPSCGELRIEVRDGNNQPIKGFAADECNPIVRNTIHWEQSAAPITWTNKKISLRKLKGKRIRLYFQMRDTYLYSFTAGTAPR